jgi:arylsulfatase A-like enzyme
MPAELSRRSFLAALGAAPLMAAEPTHNVLFVAVDDLRPDFGAYGNPKVHSPHLDRLAREGITFTRSYCQQAVCSPSRTSLLTGLRPDSTGVYELQTHFRKNIPGVVTLPEQFRKHGYLTSGFSKIYHGGLDDPQSWSVPHWVPNGPDWGSPANAARNEKLAARLKEQGLRIPPSSTPRAERGPAWRSAPGGDADQADGRTAEAVVAALEKVRGERFFLAAGFLKPHLPFVAPSKYFDLYRDVEFPLAPNPNPPRDAPAFALHNSGELRSYADIPEQGPIPEAKARELIRAYYAAISFMDAQLGKLLDALDRLELRQRTVVILWGDHGYHLGDHGLWNKHTNFERATRAPLLVSAPGMRRRAIRTEALTEFVDIYPSLCELCGVPAPAGLEGSSFAPLLENPRRRWKRAAFSQYPRGGGVMGYSMRTGRYRYTEWHKAGEVAARELYDHRADPQEDVNLAGQPAHAARVKELGGWLREGWQGARPPGA